MINVFIAIGNSDDKLPQKAWADYCGAVSDLVFMVASVIHFEGHSLPTSRWQNAMWSIEVDDLEVMTLQRDLRYIAMRFGQESIAWSEASETTFLKGSTDED